MAMTWELTAVDDATRVGIRVEHVPLALCGGSRRWLSSSLDRVGGAGEHKERATGGMRKLLGGTAVDQASDRAIAAGAYDQQIERSAVQRELLGRLTVGRVRFDAAQARDSVKGILDEALGRAIGRSRPHKGVLRKRHRFER